MSNKRICLKGGLPEGALAFVVPIKPRDGLVYSRDFKPPCQPGDTAYICETWDGFQSYNPAFDTFDWYDIIYKVDGGKTHGGKYARWRSPATMPNIACRRIWTIKSVEAVQVKNIVLLMIHDFRKLGFMKSTELFDWLTTTYPHLDMNAWMWYVEKGD